MGAHGSKEEEEKSIPAEAKTSILPQTSAADYFASYKFSDEKVDALNKNGAFLDSMDTVTNKSSRKVDLDMYQNSLLDDHAIAVLSRELSTCTECTILRIQLSCNSGFTDEGLTSLGVALREIKSITTLKLYLTSTNISSKGLQRIFEGLQGNNFYNLEIGLSETKIDDVSCYLIAQLLKSQTELATLELGTQTCLNITEKGLSFLLGGIHSLNSCSTLKLSLIGGGMKFSDKNFASLASSLETLKSLDSFESSFYDCEISDSGLSSFGSHLKNVKTLKSIELSLHKTRATKKGWDSFVKHFSFEVRGAVFKE